MGDHVSTRYKKRRDNNHAEIVATLRAAGYEVRDYASLGHVLDVCVRHGSFRAWCEVKAPGERLTAAEIEFCKFAPGLKVVVYGPQDAVDKLAACRSLRHLYSFEWDHDVIGLEKG